MYAASAIVHHARSSSSAVLHRLNNVTDPSALYFSSCVSSARNQHTGETCAVKKVTNVFTKKVRYLLPLAAVYVSQADYRASQILTKRCLRELRLLHHFRGHKNVSLIAESL